MPRIVCVSATSRPGNYTSHALALVVDELRQREQEVELLDGRDLVLPFPGHPPTDDSRRLRESVEGAAALVLATPEYHGGFSAMAKLVIENLGFPSLLTEKPMALLGVASGRIGAIKSLEQLRGVCSHAGALVLPRSVSVAGVRSAFRDDGTCTDDAVEGALRGLAANLLQFLETYVCPRYTLEAMVRGDGEAWVSDV